MAAGRAADECVHRRALVRGSLTVSVFLGVAVHELNYASGHPYAYGPARVIAWGAGAGPLLSLAVAFVGYAPTRPE